MFAKVKPKVPLGSFVLVTKGLHEGCVGTIVHILAGQFIARVSLHKKGPRTIELDWLQVIDPTENPELFI